MLSFPAEAAVRFMSPLLKPLEKNIRNTKGVNIAITYAFATIQYKKHLVTILNTYLRTKQVQYERHYNLFLI